MVGVIWRNVDFCRVDWIIFVALKRAVSHKKVYLGIEWLTFFAVVGVSGPVRFALALFALVIGTLNVKDFDDIPGLHLRGS